MRKTLFLSMLFVAFVSPVAAQPAEPAPETVAELQRKAAAAYREHLTQLEKRAVELKDRQSNLRRDIRDRSGLSPENVTPILLGLERERFTLEIEVQLKHARRDALAEMIAKETAKRRELGQADEVAEHLMRIVEARKLALAATQERHKTARSSLVDVKNAEAELAEAEVRIALRKQEKTDPAANAAIERTNQQLRDTSLEVTQEALRLEILKQKMKQLAEVQSLLDEYKTVSDSELPQLQRLLEQAQLHKLQAEGGFGRGIGARN